MKKVKKLGVKLTIVFIIFAVFLGLFITIFTYAMSYRIASRFYADKAQETAALAASYVDGDTIQSYLEKDDSGEYYTDDAYYALSDTLVNIKAEMGAKYLYVFVPYDTYLEFILEAQTDYDDPDLISPRGYIYNYTDLEYNHLVPDVKAGKASSDVIISTQNLYFGSAVSAWCPVFNSEHELVAMVEADMGLSDVLASIKSSLIVMIAVYILAILLMIFCLALLMHKMVSQPVTKLTVRALKFAGSGDPASFTDDIKTGDEMQTLSEAFVKMAGDIDSYTRTQASVAADRERISTEMQVAGTMQLSMLPTGLPDLTARKNFDVYGMLKPTLVMSGDFYDYFVLEERWLCTVICDVDAKGTTAAMLLVVAKTIIKSQLKTGEELDQSMSEVNKQIFEAIDGVPVRAFVGVLDTTDGSFTYINAGYVAPLILRRGERYEWLTSTAYAPLGMNENVAYRELQLQLHQGDRLLLYSDGVPNVKNSEGAVFGDDRLRTLLNASRTRSYSLEALVENVFSELETFADGAQMEDDVTMLAIEYKKGDRAKAELTIEGKAENTAALQRFLRDQLSENGIGGRSYAQLAVVAEELFSVCIRRCAAEAELTVSCELPPQSQTVTLTFAAPLEGRNPFEDAADVTSVNAAAFINRFADSLTFEPKDKRDLMIVKQTFHT